MGYLTIPPKYKLTKTIARLLAEIEANKAVIDSLSAPIELEQNIRRQSLLGSALFSARIEGNPLTIAEVQSFADLKRSDQKKLEIANLCRVIETVFARSDVNKKITLSEILSWHRRSMKNILNASYLGRLRQEHEGLFDTAGNVIYHAPPPQAVKALLEELLVYSNSHRERIVPVRAIIAHLVLEKIHPFVDGNGRIGRLLQKAVLTKNGYAMKGLTIVEEDIDKDRQEYYRAIEDSTSSSCQTFVELLLTFLRDSSTRARENLQRKIKNASALDLLSPRRQEITQIISDHKIISFDFLHRRFLKISPRQLAYDLTALEKSGFIKKIGRTRGAMYAAKEP